MRNIVLCISIIVTFSPLYSAEKQENFLDHQYYDADVGQALEAIQFVLNDCDIGVLGADETAGIVVSRVYEVGESESDLLEGYEEGGAFFVVLVVYVAPSSPGVVEVDVTTLLHADSKVTWGRGICAIWAHDVCESADDHQFEMSRCVVL
jgi:hypothetical protein